MDKRNGSGSAGHLEGDSLCDYAEGTLAADARDAAEAHLQGCEACRRELKVVRGYFRGMSDLDPVKAPANFLAKVRDRIERPSLWKAFWSKLGLGSGLPRPLRFIPAQIVVLTVLGAGIIIVYVHNNGGPESRPIEILMSVPAPAQDAKAEDQPMRKKESQDYAHSESHFSEPMSAPTVASAPIRPTAKLAAPASRAVAKRASSDALSESKGANQALGKVMRDDMQKSKAGKAMARSPIPGITLRMRSAKDTSALVSGLKAMGAEPDPGPRPAGVAYAFRIPAASAGEAQGYLERYGSVEHPGKSPPAAPGQWAPVYIRLPSAPN